MDVLSGILSKQEIKTMKNTHANEAASCDVQKGSKVRDLWQRQLRKVREGSFTCPLCKEVFTGLSALGAHLKKHCT